MWEFWEERASRRKGGQKMTWRATSLWTSSQTYDIMDHILHPEEQPPTVDGSMVHLNYPPSAFFFHLYWQQTKTVPGLWNGTSSSVPPFHNICHACELLSLIMLKRSPIMWEFREECASRRKGGHKMTWRGTSFWTSSQTSLIMDLIFHPEEQPSPVDGSTDHLNYPPSTFFFCLYQQQTKTVPGLWNGMSSSVLSFHNICHACEMLSLIMLKW